MAKTAAHSSLILLDQYNLSGYLNAFESSLTQEVPQAGTFADAGPRRVVGNYETVDSVNGLFDGVTATYDEWVNALLASNAQHYLGIYPGATAEGTRGYESVGKLASSSLGGEAAELIVENFTLNGSLGKSRSMVIRNASISGTGNGTGRNVGATSSPAEVVVISRAISGTFSDVVFDIQESSDDGSGDAYADITGLTGIQHTSAGVTETSVTITTEAWKRVQITTFTGTSVLLAVTIGVRAGT